MGSQLTKNYDVEKEPCCQGGLHGLWRVHRAKKRIGDLSDVSIFMFEKKQVKSKDPKIQQQIFDILKKDAMGLAKFRHPSMLNLIEQPIEDKSIIAFVTEPIEYNLKLLESGSRSDLVPSETELKCIVLELMECINFLHVNSKSIHMNIAPENLFITKSGKLKVAGLNFIVPFTSADPVPIQIDYQQRVGDYALVPNLQFAAPEVSNGSDMRVTTACDIFSVGCTIYYLVAISQKKQSNSLLQLSDSTNQQMHQRETKALAMRLQSILQSLEPNLQQIIQNMVAMEQSQRGALAQYVSNAWFQDPLLKTIRFLENIHQKEQAQKQQFLQNICDKVLVKFDRRTLLHRVVPALVETLKDQKLSTQVIQCLVQIVVNEQASPSEFRQHIWPAIVQLTKSKELPAQAIFLLLKNSELFFKQAQKTEFLSNWLPLLQKSLDCGVPKLQTLSIEQVKKLFREFDYNTQVKGGLLPRICKVLELSEDTALKVCTLECIRDLREAIDVDSMQNLIMKTFEKIRSKENDPQVCMLMLQIYEKASENLKAEDIGVKILPSLIPLAVTGNLSRDQFTDIMRSIRVLLDKIEKERIQSLPETVVSQGAGKNEGQGAAGFGQSSDLDFLEQVDRPTLPQAQNDLFAGVATAKQPAVKQTNDFDPFSSMNQAQTQKSDPFSAGGVTKPQNAMKLTPSQPAMNLGGVSNSFGQQDDPFASVINSSGSQAKPAPSNQFSGWNDSGPSLTMQAQLQPQTSSTNAFSSFNAQPQIQQPVMNSDPFASLKLTADPFASVAPTMNNTNNNMNNAMGQMGGMGQMGSMGAFGNPTTTTGQQFNAGVQPSATMTGLMQQAAPQTQNTMPGGNNVDDFFNQFANRPQQTTNKSNDPFAGMF